MRTCKEHARKVSLQDPETKKQDDYYSQEADAVQDPTASLEDFNDPQEESPDDHFHHDDKQSPEKEPTPEMDLSRESTLSTPGPIEEPNTIADNFPENFGSTQDLQIHEHQLKKYPTSDSLDEYMDECCRLSEVRNMWNNLKSRPVQTPQSVFKSCLSQIRHIWESSEYLPWNL